MPSRDKLLLRATGGACAAFAARELARYVRAMDAQVQSVLLDAPREGEIELKADPQALKARGIALKDPEIDDAFWIEVREGAGWILGSNERSVLIGVYVLLEMLGCRFLRPGRQNEILGSGDLRMGEYHALEQAKVRHRGVVIEGADSVENLLDFLDWMPKARYNSFFTQFTSIHLFFERYYRHWNNPTLAPEPYGREQTAAFERRMEEAMRLRGMERHAVGHGWTCGAMGVEGIDWEQVAEAVDETVVPLLAKVDGKRAFFHGVPSTTNLCYSNREARRRLIAYVSDYLAAHPEITYASVWLADDCNNFCQCDACRSLRPSDWYLLVLNELDEELDRRGIKTHIVFLTYLDLLWPPLQNRITHPQRFTFMFAPFTRPYGASLGDFSATPIAPFVLDKIELPQSVGENLGYLERWQKVWQGDSFLFDYYLGRAHYGDLGYMRLSRVIARDVEALERLKLNGLMSCQELRAAFPTALPNYLLGRKLWNPTQETESVIAEYFSGAFGMGWETALDYLNAMSESGNIDDWFRGMRTVDETAAKRWLRAGETTRRYGPMIRRQEALHQGAQALSWRYLTEHLTYSVLFAKAMYARQCGQNECAEKAFAELAGWLNRMEPELEPVLDVFRVLEIGKNAGFHPFEKEKTEKV